MMIRRRDSFLVCAHCRTGFDIIPSSRQLVRMSLDGEIREVEANLEATALGGLGHLCPHCLGQLARKLADKIEATETIYYTQQNSKESKGAKK
jgi:hypothetical protein